MKKESFIRDSSMDVPTIVEIIRQVAEKLHVSFVEKQGIYYFSLFSKSSNDLNGFPLHYHVGVTVPEHIVGSVPEIRLFCGQYEDDLERILRLNLIDKQDFLQAFKAAPFDEALFEHGYSDIHEQEDKAAYAASLPLMRALIKKWRYRRRTGVWLHAVFPCGSLRSKTSKRREIGRYDIKESCD